MRRIYAALALIAWFLAVVPAPSLKTSSGAADEASPRKLEQIVDAMVEQGRKQRQALKGYKAVRHFEASNRRFKLRANLTVLTTFRQPDRYESKVVAFEGSQFIRDRVFKKILEEEKAVRKPENDIVPENYHFELAGVETCDSGQCYKLVIHPKEKSKYRLRGFIWVNRKDYGLVRILGSPSKRASFWTRRTVVERRYENRAGVWMTRSINSVSDVFLAGRSTFSITYKYLTVDGLPGSRGKGGATAG